MILLKVQPLACRRDEGKLAGNPDGLSRERAGKEQGDSRRRRRAAESDTLKVVSPSSEGAAQPISGVVGRHTFASSCSGGRVQARSVAMSIVTSGMCSGVRAPWVIRADEA